MIIEFHILVKTKGAVAVDGGGGGESAAKGLEVGRLSFFSRCRCRRRPGGCPNRLGLPEKTNRRSELWTASQTFSPPITRTALEFSHSLAICWATSLPWRLCAG